MIHVKDIAFRKNCFLLDNDNSIKEVKLIKEIIYKDRNKYTVEYQGKKIEFFVPSGENRFCYDEQSCLNFDDPTLYIELSEDDFYENKWVFKDNKVMRKKIPIKCIEYPGRLVTYDTDDEVYDSDEECLAFNKIQATNIDGYDLNIQSSGYMKAITTYSEEQLKAIENLQQAINEVNKTMTILLGYDGMHICVGRFDVDDCNWGNYDNTKPIYLKHCKRIDGIKINNDSSPEIVMDTLSFG